MTTPSPERLLELAARCEAAEGPSYSLDCEIWDEIHPGDRNERFNKLNSEGPLKGRLGPADRDGYIQPLLAYSASLDAAMQLVPEGFVWTVYGGYARAPDSAEVGREPTGGELMTPVASADATTPALALTAAALRSLAEEGEQ